MPKISYLCNAVTKFLYKDLEREVYWLKCAVLIKEHMQQSYNTTNPRIIFHIDLDYFFAQCEEIRRPEIKDRPVVICIYSGRTKESGVVSTCNYLARKYGVKSGIPIKIAKSKLPHISLPVFLPPDIKYYSEKSDNTMTLIRDFVENSSLPGTGSVVYQGTKCVKFEYIGLDECFVEVTDIVA